MKRKGKIIIAAAAAAVIAAVIIAHFRSTDEPASIMKEAHPTRGTIELSVPTTGVVQPKNRLEIKPTVSGRIEKMPFDEGQTVRQGQIIAWMSSSDRAALIDAARAKGAKELAYWEDAYKPIPIVSPIRGTVIVRGVEPGQTLTTSTVIYVISDYLIVMAQLDETDIGRVALGQRAMVSLDAHPEISVEGKVSHISYESKTVNNVTMYDVEIIINKMPAVFRSGMSANITIISKRSENALLIPAGAIMGNNGGKFVLVKGANKGKPERRPVTTGLTDEKNIEILSGLTENDTIMIPTKKFVIPKSDTTRSPFQPQGPGGRRAR